MAKILILPVLTIGQFVLIDDKKFYTSDKMIGSEKYFKIKLLESYKSGSLTLEMLKSQGVKSNFQGPTIASGTLLELLKKLN